MLQMWPLKKKKVACILLYRILKKPVLKIQDLMELSETVLKKKKKKGVDEGEEYMTTSTF